MQLTLEQPVEVVVPLTASNMDSQINELETQQSLH